MRISDWSSDVCSSDLVAPICAAFSRVAIGWSDSSKRKLSGLSLATCNGITQRHIEPRAATIMRLGSLGTAITTNGSIPESRTAITPSQLHALLPDYGMGGRFSSQLQNTTLPLYL